MKNLAIIPAKQFSRRFSGKNAYRFKGKPMFEYPVVAARDSKLFDEIHFTTDSPRFLKAALRRGATHRQLRPKHLTRDNVQLNDLTAYILKQYEKEGVRFDNVCLIYATAPLITAVDLRRAYQILKKGKLDSVSSAVALSKPPLYAVYYDHGGGRYTSMTKQLPQFKQNRFLADCGGFCWFTARSFKQTRSRFGRRHRFLVLPKWKSVDVDYKEDIELLEFYYQRYFKKRGRA